MERCELRALASQSCLILNRRAKGVRSGTFVKTVDHPFLMASLNSARTPSWIHWLAGCWRSANSAMNFSNLPFRVVKAAWSLVSFNRDLIVKNSNFVAAALVSALSIEVAQAESFASTPRSFKVGNRACVGDKEATSTWWSSNASSVGFYVQH